MTSAPSNLPIKNILSETAYTTSKGKEITYEDLAKCTGTSESLPARYLSRLDVFLKGGGIITDAKVDKMLNKILEDNGYSALNKISDQFKQEASNISHIATNIDYSAKELKSDSKDLKHAEDLIKLFIKFQAEKETKVTIEDLRPAEKAQQKAEDKRIRKESTEPRELKEINDAKFILKARASLTKKSPLFLLKAAAWENQAHLENNKDQLSQDFHNFLNKQVPYPTDKEGLNTAYQNFISKTLEKTEHFQKNIVDPYDEGFKAHTAKVKDYIKPKRNSLAEYVEKMSLDPSLASVKNGKLSQDSYNTLAQELYNMDERTLLLHIQKESRLEKLRPRLDELRESLSSNEKRAVQSMAKNTKVQDLGYAITQLQLVAVNLTESKVINYLNDASLRDHYNFLDLIDDPNFQKSNAFLKSNALKGQDKLNYMHAVYEIAKGLNISETTKQEIDAKLLQLENVIKGKNSDEVERLVEEHNNIFDKAGLEALNLIKEDLRKI
jgi:hypothetical protein